MKNPLFSMLGIAAALALPHTSWAQAAGAAAACPPPPVQVQVNVDYVVTNWPNFLDESARIGPGKDHDALLLAALIKDGAQRRQATQITTTNGVQAYASQVTKMPAPLPPLTSFIHVKPRINKSGTITVTIANHLEWMSHNQPPRAILPSTEMSDTTDTNTFIDGQTLIVDNIRNEMSSDNSYSLTFAKVKTVAMPAHPPAAVQYSKHP